MKRDKRLGYIVALATALALGFWVSRHRTPAAPMPEVPPSVTAPLSLPTSAPNLDERYSPEEKNNIDLFERAKPSVVYITTLVLRRSLFSVRATEVPQGTGSGFIWDDKGHIVTNFHVIRGADVARITFSDGSTYDATLVGAAPEKDLAVLYVKAPQELLHSLSIGASNDLKVGQKALAIGNPFGLDHTLTIGVISALGREIQSVARRPIQGVIQTDAAINPGNSGGPLLDSMGRLIGINTLIYSPSGAFAGIGFAVPVDMARRIVPQLIKHGKVIRPGFGIVPAEDRVSRQFVGEGVLILNVFPNSAAAKAQLEPTLRDQYGRISLGDILIGIDDHPIRDLNDLFRVLDDHKVGDPVTVVYLRAGKERKVTLRLQALD